MKDPGFVPGIIGWVIGFFMAYIIEQINIVGSFPEQLKALKIQRGNYAKVLRENPTHPTDLEEWEKLSRKISEMLKSGSAVFRFSFIYRYWMCKKITSLIKDIEMHQSLLLLRIGGGWEEPDGSGRGGSRIDTSSREEGGVQEPYGCGGYGFLECSC